MTQKSTERVAIIGARGAIGTDAVLTPQIHAKSTVRLKSSLTTCYRLYYPAAALAAMASLPGRVTGIEAEQITFAVRLTYGGVRRKLGWEGIKISAVMKWSA